LGAFFGSRKHGRDPVHSRRYVSHGIGSALSGRGSGAAGRRGRFLDRPDAGQQSAISQIRQRNRARYARRVAARREGLSRCASRNAQGRLVDFCSPRGPVDLRDWSQWWQFKFGANWRRPYGPRSSISGLDDHPVVHIAYRDAEAYAQWAGKALPTEAEWEFAARGGLDGAEFAWGEEFTPGGKHQANTWQGEFPGQNLAIDGYERTSPVTAFPANGYGLYDMIGNVWEWTADWFTPRHDANARSPCCAPDDPRGAAEETS
jgi:formylglycine-generating enzyme required for sulfatase activity